jgi:dTDP-glucose pyrophosphorylase
MLVCIDPGGSLKPSARGELEITDVNLFMKKERQMDLILSAVSN